MEASALVLGALAGGRLGAWSGSAAKGGEVGGGKDR